MKIDFELKVNYDTLQEFIGDLDSEWRTGVEIADRDFTLFTILGTTLEITRLINKDYTGITLMGANSEQGKLLKIEEMLKRAF